MRQLALAFAGFLLLEAVAILIGLEIVGSPLLTGPWPSAVTQTSLRDEARAALSRCAESTDASPAGCPQHTTQFASPVAWTLVGDPLRHSGFEMTGSSGPKRTFQVWGDVAMVATSGDQVATFEGPYIASVDWNGSSLLAGGVRRGDFDTDRPPEATDTAARVAAQAAFRRCAAAPDRLLCPVVEGTVARLSPSNSWTAAAAVVHDASSGVVHVRGRVTGPIHAAYDASEVVDSSGHMTCYSIAYSSS